MGENVSILEWPSYSLDLDPIENVWKCIKDEINKKCKKEYQRNDERNGVILEQYGSQTYT